MQQNIQLKIIPFAGSIEEVEFAFYTAKQDASHPNRQSYCAIHKNDLNGTIKGLVVKKKPTFINQIKDLVYQFSQMYWKSVSHQNFPVRIKYPEMLAQIAPHFESAEIPHFGKDNLWVL